MAVISSKDLLGYNDHGFHEKNLESYKENILKYDLKEEVAALKEMVIKQGQEISGLKEEVSLFNKKTKEQELLMHSQEKVKSDLQNVVQKQNEKIAEMQTVMKRQSSQIIVLKETVDHQSDRIRTLEIQLKTEELFENGENEDATDFTNVTGQYVFSNKNLPEAYAMNEGFNSTKSARKSRATASINIAFSTYLDHSLYHLSSGHVIKCNQVLLNVGNAYNTYTGSFTVPRAGVYLLTFTINCHISGTITYLKLISNNRNIIDAVCIPPGKFHDIMGGNTAIVQLSAGESVWLEVFGTTNGQLQTDGTYRYVSFSGVLLF